jgi:hypothetical protein
MTTTTKFEVWLRSRGPNNALCLDSSNEPSRLSQVGTYDTLTEAQAAAAETGMSPLVTLGTNEDLPSYPGIFVHAVNLDAATGLRVWDRR